MTPSVNGVVVTRLRAVLFRNGWETRLFAACFDLSEKIFQTIQRIVFLWV